MGRISARLAALRTAVDEWIRLGLTGALLAATLLFVHVPATVWSGNPAEFDLRFTSLLPFALTAVFVALVVTFFVLLALPRSLKATIACLVAALGLVWWFYGQFFVDGMTVLNGRDAPMDFNTRLGAWELLLTLTGVVLLAFSIGRIRQVATVFLLMLNIGLVVATTVSVVAARRVPTHAAAWGQDAAFRFSPDRNVLVILLDGLQSDVADEVLGDTPQLAAAFDGFRSFRDTLSVAPTTFLSLPAIHSGKVYFPGEGLLGYFSESITRHSFMSRFADAGYQTTLVNPIEGMCPDRVTVCANSSSLISSRADRLAHESRWLFDLSLFRVSPMWLKRRIYDDGRWLLSTPGSRSATVDTAEQYRTFDTNRILEGVHFFDEVARRLTLNSGAPTVKFLHSAATHTPYVLNERCEIAESHLSHVSSQARCTLAAVARLLGRLKQVKIYDHTVILVLSDHGINPGIFSQDAPGSYDQWLHRAGAANPLFLLKGRGERGALRESLTPVYLADVGATLCAASGACAAPRGIPAGQASPDRSRRFYEYTWKHEYWTSRGIPAMTAYDVVGPLWRPESWSRAPSPEQDE